jgi:hypothetical protein
MAKLDEPIPVLGLQRQRLGVVRYCGLALEKGRLAELSLETRWQIIRLDASQVRYDPQKKVFMLQ